MRAARITQRLLAFARKQPLIREPLNLNKALEDMEEMLRRTIGEQIEVRMHLSDVPGIVETDIDQFEIRYLDRYEMEVNTGYFVEIRHRYAEWYVQSAKERQENILHRFDSQ